MLRLEVERFEGPCDEEDDSQLELEEREDDDDRELEDRELDDRELDDRDDDRELDDLELDDRDDGGMKSPFQKNADIEYFTIFSEKVKTILKYLPYSWLSQFQILPLKAFPLRGRCQPVRKLVDG